MVDSSDEKGDSTSEWDRRWFKLKPLPRHHDLSGLPYSFSYVENLSRSKSRNTPETTFMN